MDSVVTNMTMQPMEVLPAEIQNWVAGEELPAADGLLFDKLNPADGTLAFRGVRSGEREVEAAVRAGVQDQLGWAATTPVRRGEILLRVAEHLHARREEMARLVALETGKSYRMALGETAGAVALGRFMAGEGQRLYGRTTVSGTPNKWAMTVRHPLGVAGLIVAANTPIANVAWKVFPALICGNTAVLKAAEDTPATAWLFGKIAREAGLPTGVLNIVQGLGAEAGAAIVRHPDVAVISFTGSTAVGREIAVTAGRRLAKVSLELGGKNPLVVCDDADLESACRWVVLSAFSNAGQRCASGSRILIFDSIYERFCEMLIEATARLRVGPGDDDDLGPVINERQLNNMLAAVERAREGGARILVGGSRLVGPRHRDGFYMSPTLVDGVQPQDELSQVELFGPIAVLYRVADFEEAMRLANSSPYGLTGCIHTRSVHRAMAFCERLEAGVAVVNAGTYGSEPHMPFGGVKQSGNGSREPGTEALDVYSNLKNVYLNFDPSLL